jgi:hypothetical protein
VGPSLKIDQLGHIYESGALQRRRFHFTAVELLGVADSLPLRWWGSCEFNRDWVRFGQLWEKLGVVSEWSWLRESSVWSFLWDNIDSLSLSIGIAIGGPSNLSFNCGMNGVISSHFHILTRMPLVTSLLGNNITFSNFGITPLFNSESSTG